MQTWRTIRNLIGVTAVVLILIGTMRACASLRNFPDPSGPRRVGAFATETPTDTGSMRVVTWNISWAEKIDQAIDELQAVDELAGADVLLLQEMDESGAEAIAQAMGYDYVYYPASVHRHGRGFGNAVLSRWPIVSTEKIVLPHPNMANEQMRIAVRADLQIGERIVPVYSVHTETILAGRGKQREQHQYLVDAVPSDAPYVVVGGDFNTFVPGAVDALDEMWAEVGMERVSKDAGRSFNLGPVTGPGLDHVYARGFTPVDSGVVGETSASDHSPLWVDLRFDESL